MPAGRPAKADPGVLYTFAHQFYWDFVRIDEGIERPRFQRAAFAAFEKTLDERLRHSRLRVFDDQLAAIHRAVDDEIRSGGLKAILREERVRELLDLQQRVNREWLLQEKAQEAITVEKVPGKPEVIDALLRAKTARDVRDICADAIVIETREVAPGLMRDIQLPKWPIAYGSMLPVYMAEHALSIIAARHDPRFPNSERPSSRRRQLWFLSRALAGALFGVEPRTAINLVNSRRPEEQFESSGGAKRPRRR
jgi:hypothetical protein